MFYIEAYVNVFYQDESEKFFLLSIFLKKKKIPQKINKKEAYKNKMEKFVDSLN